MKQNYFITLITEIFEECLVTAQVNMGCDLIKKKNKKKYLTRVESLFFIAGLFVRHEKKVKKWKGKDEAKKQKAKPAVAVKNSDTYK